MYSRRSIGISLLLVVFLPAFILAQETINQKDTQGRKHGEWKKKENGRLVYEGQFEHGTPHGRFVYYYPEGGVKAITHFSDNGQTAQTKLYHNNGRLMGEGRYLDQQKDGLWKYFNEDEILVAQEEYKKGVKQGTWLTYYENGQVSEEVSWEDGEREGIWKQYFPDGTLKSRAIYIDDRLEGLAQFFYASGKVMMSGTYVNSLKDGTWIVFNEDGRTATREEYSKGFLVKSEDFEGFEKVKTIREDEEGNEFKPGHKPKYELKDPKDPGEDGF